MENSNLTKLTNFIFKIMLVIMFLFYQTIETTCAMKTRWEKKMKKKKKRNFIDTDDKVPTSTVY